MTFLKRLFHFHDWEFKHINYMPPNSKRKFPVNMWVYKCRSCSKIGLRPIKLKAVK
jgi:hypothetical protein